MNLTARKRVLAAAAALSAYAAGCTTQPAEPFNQAADTEKLDYARPASIERAEDYDVRLPRASRGRASRGGTRPRTGYSGDLPPMRVVMCESGGSYTAENPSSTASGRYQILDSSWAGFGGYRHAADAPPEVQDAKARAMWADGRGAHHWRQCL